MYLVNISEKQETHRENRFAGVLRYAQDHRAMIRIKVTDLSLWIVAGDIHPEWAYPLDISA
jgi:hypothetical protein